MNAEQRENNWACGHKSYACCGRCADDLESKVAYFTAQLSEARKEVERLNRLEQANFDFIKYQVPKSSVCVNLGEAVGFLTAEVGSLTALLESSKVREDKMRYALINAEYSVLSDMTRAEKNKDSEYLEVVQRRWSGIRQALAEGKGEA